MSTPDAPAGNVVGIAPDVTPETTAFWEEASRGRLVVDHCDSCGTDYFPPRAWCAKCETGEHINDRHALSGPARLYSFTINHVSWLPGLSVPYVLGLAHFDEAPGVRIPIRVRAVSVDDVTCDVELDIDFEDGPAGHRIPSMTVRSSSSHESRDLS